MATVLFELNDDELHLAVAERRVDAVILPRHTRRPGSTAIPMWTERLCVALPDGRALTTRKSLGWQDVPGEVILTQEWEGSHVSKEFFESLIGGAVTFAAHASSKQSVLALVGVGHGITLAAASQSEVSIRGVIVRPIAEKNALFHLELAWALDIKRAVLGRFIAFVRDHGRQQIQSVIRPFIPAALKPDSRAEIELTR